MKAVCPMAKPSTTILTALKHAIGCGVARKKNEYARFEEATFRPPAPVLRSGVNHKNISEFSE